MLKTSVLLPCANPATAAALEELGATTINVSTDLSPTSSESCAPRARRRSTSTSRCRTTRAASCASTTYRRSSALAAPVYVKLGLRNAPNIYPSGLHLEDLAVKLGRERVRRAELVLRLLAERAPELVEGRGDDRPTDLGIPEP